MKARFKTIILSALGALSAFSAVTYTSCQPDKCKAIVCAYGGTCKEGTCICLPGYEGYQCETITRDKFKGVWTVFEKGTESHPAQYDIVVEDGMTMTEMKIRNFNNLFKNGEEVVVGIKGDSLFIPQQNVNGYVIQGKGYLPETSFYGRHGEMKVNYSVKLKDGRVNDYGLNIGTTSVWTR